MKKELINMVRLLNKNGHNCILTGTYALHLLGLSDTWHDAHDLDFKVKGSKKEMNDIKRLLLNNGYEAEISKAEMYEEKCLMISKDDVEVNIIFVGNTGQYLSVNVTNDDEESKPDLEVIKIEPVFAALKAKMNLQRFKDFDYMFRLIEQLSTISHE